MGIRYKVLHLGNNYYIFDYKKYTFVKDERGMQIAWTDFDENGKDRAETFCMKLNQNEEATTNKEVQNGQAIPSINTNDGVVESAVCNSSATKANSTGIAKNKHINNNNSKTSISRDRLSEDSRLNRHGVRENEALKGVPDCLDVHRERRQ
jgi:hypothetical protein